MSLIIGNWKMNKTIKEAISFIKELKQRCNTKNEIVICPPFTALYPISQEIKNTEIKLGAQNMHYELEGAFTGEISGTMLKEIGCKYVIIGHSERRLYFHETEEIINKKIISALNQRLIPILCIGETTKQRKEKKTKHVIINQLKNAFRNIKEIEEIVIAYEPIWAIGTGKNATPEDAEEVHNFIHSFMNRISVRKLSIVYGGSVTPENVTSLISQPHIDGVLIGGASLDITKFSKIIQISK